MATNLDHAVAASPSSINDTNRRFLDSEPDDLDESVGAASPSSFCSCLPAHCFGRRSHAYLLQVNQDQEPRGGRWLWVVEKLKKAWEVSEVVAGPRWKNFILRFSGTIRRSSEVQFQYDAQSYALNFDDGVGTAHVDCGYPGFSARYAAPAAVSQLLRT